jgi:guanyl-specific ribonuclease Sa
MWLGWVFAAGLLAAAAYVVLQPAPAMSPEATGALPPAATGANSDSSPGAIGTAPHSSPAATGASDVPCEMCRVPGRWAASKVPKTTGDDAAKTTDVGAAKAPGDIAPQDANGSQTADTATPQASDRAESRAPAPEQEPAAREADRAARESQAERPASLVELHPGARIDTVVVRDHGERVLLRGTIELEPTLERIDAGRRLEFPDDGIVFQNRERRLPHQPRGYYHEYVIPTGGLSGPGPQRVVVGSGGEVYYTPDHYRTFRRIP